jgi:DNA primase
MRLGVERVTICLDRDAPGKAAAARVVERAVHATQSPAIMVLDSEQLAPSKDPDAFLRQRGPQAWFEVLGKRECGIAWRAQDLLDGVTTESAPLDRRDALGRAGRWLGALPERYALEQEDAVRVLAERCGYSSEAIERAFRARFWNAKSRSPERARARAPIELGRD